VYNWKVYFVAAVASAGAATIGYDSAFIGGTMALPAFREDLGFTEMSKSQVNLISANIVSCYQAGAFFGAFFAYPSGHFLGRRLSLILFALLFLVGASVMLGTKTGSGVGYLYGGRVVAGLGIGGISNIIPIYLAEISPPAIRGRLVGMWEIGWQCGGLVGFWINVSSISDHSSSEYGSNWLCSMGSTNTCHRLENSGLSLSPYNSSPAAYSQSVPSSSPRLPDGFWLLGNVHRASNLSASCAICPQTIHIYSQRCK
jgi:MFS family permease